MNFNGGKCQYKSGVVVQGTVVTITILFWQNFKTSKCSTRYFVGFFFWGGGGGGGGEGFFLTKVRNHPVMSLEI